MYVKNLETKKVLQVPLTLTLTQLYIEAENSYEQDRAYKLIEEVQAIHLQRQQEQYNNRFKNYALQQKNVTRVKKIK